MRRLLLIAACCGGCSVTFGQHHVPKVPGSVMLTCSTSKTLPTVDTVIAVAATVNSVTFAFFGDRFRPLAEEMSPNMPGFRITNSDVRVMAVLGSAAIAMLFASSSTIGSDRVGDCRRARDERTPGEDHRPDGATPVTWAASE